MELDRIYEQDALKDWPLADESVHCIVTSPPYWNLRDYSIAGQLGLEKTPNEYIERMIQVFREARRVLRKDGTLWVNIGDSYATAGGTRTEQQATAKSGLQGGKGSQIAALRQRSLPNTDGIKAKDMVGIPWLLAFALRADGWYLRQDIIWSKPNPMPESVNDRCTKSHEYIFLFSRSPTYYFDQKAISEPCSPNTNARLSQDVEKQIGSARAAGGAKLNGNMKAVPGKLRKLNNDGMAKNNSSFAESVVLLTDRRNKRSVWEVVTEGFSEAHFATFPQKLITDCIKAGCPPGGTVLDPFMGAGTTALVARKLDRHFIGFELNPAYIEMANNRLKKELGMFF